MLFYIRLGGGEKLIKFPLRLVFGFGRLCVIVRNIYIYGMYAFYARLAVVELVNLRENVLRKGSAL